jgi:hypothetical protein
MSRDVPESYGDNRVLLTVEGYFQDYSVTAFSCPDAEGRTFIDSDKEIGDVHHTEKYGAPFAVDVVIHDPIYPQEGEVEAIRDELGTEFQEQFDGKIDNVFEQLKDSEDPFEDIKNMETDDLQ